MMYYCYPWETLMPYAYRLSCLEAPGIVLWCRIYLEKTASTAT